MKILVTGSSGHLGEALVRTLQAAGHAVVGVDILPSAFTSQVGSLTSRSHVRQCMQGVEAVLHTATLHKPHIATHSYQDFVDTNLTGTLHLLEEALLAGVQAFVFTSTTSTFGDALTPPAGAPAAWITETVAPIPKNIYGVTKTAAEDLCQLFHHNHGLACVVLRVARFFPEDDDQKQKRQVYTAANLNANEYLYRRVDIADVVDAHLLALKQAGRLGFGRFLLSATTPFGLADLPELPTTAPVVVRRYFPDYEAEYARRGWQMFPSIERVYVNTLARQALGWQPRYDFRYVLNCLQADTDPRSSLARLVGTKGYHSHALPAGPYPMT